MVAAVADIIDLLDLIAPPVLAEDWDNAGLQIGDGRWTVRKGGVALDASVEVVEAACAMHVDLLVTHHPLIFKPLVSIDCQTSIGSIVQKALQHRLAIFAVHTNLDKTRGGLNDVLARRIGLLNCTVLEAVKIEDDNRLMLNSASDESVTLKRLHNQEGFGRVGTLSNAMHLQDFARAVKQKLNLDFIKIVGRPDLVIRKAAVCTGSGSDLLKTFFSSGAQVYISGDLKFHDARDVEAADLGMIDIGHFSSEYIMVESMVKRLAELISHNRLEVDVSACGTEKDPFVTL